MNKMMSVTSIRAGLLNFTRPTGVNSITGSSPALTDLIRKDMTREEFIKTVDTLVERYIENADSFDLNPQLRINPATFDMTIVNSSDMLDEIEDSNEAIEDAAAAERAATEEYTDYQVSRNPDFYAVNSLTKTSADGKTSPDSNAIAKVAEIYF